MVLFKFCHVRVSTLAACRAPRALCIKRAYVQARPPACCMHACMPAWCVGHQHARNASSSMQEAHGCAVHTRTKAKTRIADIICFMLRMPYLSTTNPPRPQIAALAACKFVRAVEVARPPACSLARYLYVRLYVFACACGPRSTHLERKKRTFLLLKLIETNQELLTQTRLLLIQIDTLCVFGHQMVASATRRSIDRSIGACGFI